MRWAWKAAAPSFMQNKRRHYLLNSSMFNVKLLKSKLSTSKCRSTYKCTLTHVTKPDQTYDTYATWLSPNTCSGHITPEGGCQDRVKRQHFLYCLYNCILQQVIRHCHERRHSRQFLCDCDWKKWSVCRWHNIKAVSFLTLLRAFVVCCFCWPSFNKCRWQILYLTARERTRNLKVFSRLKAPV
jgi:hypothetical protein